MRRLPNDVAKASFGSASKKNASKKKPKTDNAAGHWRKSIDLSIALTRAAKKFRKGNAIAMRR